ncbi:MAG: ribosomal protein L7/L12 [Candidatus Shikimatogenerans sp. JK-2022]|nr:ribosomal protein L7/L12 [Candidatus Shikimatogenerans bostrichidophilus]
MKKIKKIAKEIIKLNLQEINDLYNILEKDYGLNLKYEIEKKEEKTNNKNINYEEKDKKEKIENNLLFDIYLKSIGTIKLPVIKLINNITGLSLTESKKKIDNIPSLIKKSIKLEEAKKIQEDFKKIEADIELKESI